MDQELQVVQQDLDYLTKEWDQEVSDDSLRRSSPVLRRFLVEGQLLRAWRNIGFVGQPEVVALTLSKRLSVGSLNAVKFASAGGAEYQGKCMGQTFLSDEALAPSEIQKIAGLGPPEVKQNLTDFVNSPCVVVEGTTISRLELIKYVANKLGGAHYDSKREKDYQRLLDYAGQTYSLAGKNSVYFELLSVGQALVRSPDIGKLREKLRQFSTT